MIKFKSYLISIVIFFSITISSYSKGVPESFEDLAEKLIPSVLNISTTQTIVTSTNPFPFQFPPGSPFGDISKNSEHHKRENHRR